MSTSPQPPPHRQDPRLPVAPTDIVDIIPRTYAALPPFQRSKTLPLAWAFEIAFAFALLLATSLFAHARTWLCTTKVCVHNFQSLHTVVAVGWGLCAAFALALILVGVRQHLHRRRQRRQRQRRQLEDAPYS